MTYTLPQLDYPYDALEPYMDSRTMEIHHSKHHQKYVDKVNAAIQGTTFEKEPVEQLLRNLQELPEDIRNAVRNHGGGHANHSLFWKVIGPKGGTKPSGKLAQMLTETFGGSEEFKKSFAEAAAGQFGSGWAWLSVRENKLVVESTANQDTPLSTGGIPLMCVDVWEHAYYLKYQNRRTEYISAFLEVINWTEVASRYEAL